MSEKLELSIILPASPGRIYQAWLDGEEHGAFTGSPAGVEARVGGSFTAWDGYIWGITLEMEPERRIVQSWRTGDFPAEAPDSRLEVLLEAAVGGARLTLVHTNIPDGQAENYRQGWEDYYFEPMRGYFAGG